MFSLRVLFICCSSFPSLVLVTLSQQPAPLFVPPWKPRPVSAQQQMWSPRLPSCELTDKSEINNCVAVTTNSWMANVPPERILSEVIARRSKRGIPFQPWVLWTRVLIKPDGSAVIAVGKWSREVCPIIHPDPAPRASARCLPERCSRLKRQTSEIVVRLWEPV